MTNHFKLQIKNSGLIHIYQVDFGMLEEEYHISALRSGQQGITANVGIHMISQGDKDNHRRLIFAMQMAEEPTFTVISAANG